MDYYCEKAIKSIANNYPLNDNEYYALMKEAKECYDRYNSEARKAIAYEMRINYGSNFKYITRRDEMLEKECRDYCYNSSYTPPRY